MLRFVNSVDGPRLAELGTSCPDHFLRTKIKPLFVDWDPAAATSTALEAALEEGVAQYRADYAAYYERYRRPDSPPMRDPNPTVVLIPGLGMIAWGKNKSESRVTAEFYNCAIEVMRGAEAIDRYEAMDPQEAFDIEYWSLEEAKLRRLPPEKELDRQVVVVVGAGSGIGKATAQRLVAEGAHVVCVDRDEAAAKTTAAEIVARYGDGIGVAGTGLSNCGPAIGLGCDITDRDSVARMLGEVVLAYGGLDAVVVTAGIFVPPDRGGRIADDQWATTFGVNVTGAYIVADEAKTIFERQGLSGEHRAHNERQRGGREEGQPRLRREQGRGEPSRAGAGRRDGAARPRERRRPGHRGERQHDVPARPRHRVAEEVRHRRSTSRTPTTSFGRQLADFYAQRSLLRRPIEPDDQAEAVALLLSRRLSKTTGHVIPVDGGLQDGFLR